MNEHHYQRIDKGRKKAKRLKWREVEQEGRQRTRNEKGMFLPEYPPETRSRAILEAIEGIQTGSKLPRQVGEQYGIPESTIYSWLIVDPRASQARAQFFADRLGDHLGRIEVAADPLELARAREAYRAWADIASKRDPANYGVKQEITHVQADLGDRLRRAKERVIEGEACLLKEGPQEVKKAPTEG